MTSRKRRAPGASPIVQQNTFPDTQTTAPDTYMNTWEPTAGAEMNGFGDGAFYDQLGAYNANFGQQPSAHSRVVSLDEMNGGTDMGAGTLVRRNTNQQLAARGRSPWGDAFNGQGQPGWENTDDDEELERKAAIAKKDASAKRKTIPPFVQKLSSFLDNGNNTNLIRWSDDGNSFIVLDEDEFARTLIPELFKHNNYASFVRQLNMYGFHKKVGLSDNSMKASETKAKAPSEYFNKYFKRGRPELLWLIQKPKNTPAGPKRRKDDDTKGDSDEDRKYAPDGGGGGYIEELAVRGNSQEMTTIPRSEYNSLRAEVRTLQQQQKVISNVLGQIRRQNDQLYQQATAFQTLHDRHENSINAILTFLATFYNRSLEGNTNNINFADMFGPAMPNQQPQGSVVDMENFSEVPVAKSPLAQKKVAMKLLPAPPTRHIDPILPRAKTVSPSASAAPTPIAEKPPVARPHMPQSRDATARQTNAQSTYGGPLKVESNSPPNQVPMTLPENDEIMSAIQNANANASAGGYSQAPQIDLPAALNSYQHQDGHTPLTTQQRNDVLSLMAHNTSAASPNSAFAANTNNALNNPHPPPMPNLEQLQETEAQLAYLQRVSEEQNSRVQSLQERLQPLSPSGQIPGLDANNSYFGNAIGEPGQYDLNHDLDLDSFVQGDDFFPATTAGDGMGLTATDTLPDLNYQLTGDDSGFGDAPGDGFDFGTANGHLGVQKANGGGTVESVSTGSNGSNATSPASATVEEVEDETRRSPKRRKK
ncbi:hypothetical protein BU23DRAFT_173160 [Bimuria novae-zelandiae CBS 107.79]|uniref:HSF-type DNA-binding domain-containing protein n=1 Tax=Bimuria novae-zelandiae CBS 107.79 TaxID=1447943 RepID=A0A6A5V444_9PLEO|nr:hypothetical protein BU23DRAFT_173160 [Bimuria novae-zelandiae CBS 107.79]